MIELKDVSFQYNRGENSGGIHNLNLTIQNGETILLCGESGCGKTTLTRLLNGLIPQYYEGTLTGSVCMNGVQVSSLPLYETGKQVGSVFQNPRSQFFTVDTNSELAFGCENRGLPEPEIRQRIQATVTEFRLQPLLNRSIFQLSGGEKQKIACASVAAGHPDVFVLDEPSSNLDMEAVEDLRQMIAAWKAKGKTIVVAEHRLYYLRHLADRIVYMKQGRIEREYTADAFNRLPREELAALGLRPLRLEQLEAARRKSSDAENWIRMTDFRFSYRGLPDAVHIPETAIPKGCAAAVIGANGAGKSTFARCLCGLNKGCKGCVASGRQTRRGKQLVQGSYMVMQDVNHQLFAETVLDEVLLSMAQSDAQTAKTILSQLDLLALQEVHPMALSGGQKQRVAIAGAVAAQKEILIFDEPTSGLDLKHMNEVADVMQTLCAAGKTLLVISHDLEFILQSCTHVLHMRDGEVLDGYPLDATGTQKLKTAFLQTRLR